MWQLCGGVSHQLSTMPNALALFCVVCLAGAQARVCSVQEHGALPDGKTINTKAFAAAVAACAGGGTVLVPAGGVFVTGPFNLTSHIVLEVEGTIRGLDDPAQLPLMAPFPSMAGSVTRDGYPCRYAPLIGAFRQTNLSIVGTGLIDGAGEWWWENRMDKSKVRCEWPRLLELQWVDGLELAGLRLVNSPFWTVHPYASRNIHIHHIQITAEGRGRLGSNTDGIDPDSCENVLIEDYYYCAGDDAVSASSRHPI